MSSATADYKARKEAFVSNLSGSDLTDINLVTLVAASAIFLWSVLKKRKLISNDALGYIIDFLLNVCAILFAFTVYSSFPLFLNLVLIVPAAILALEAYLQPDQKPKSKKNIEPSNDTGDGDDTIQVASTPSRKGQGRAKKSTTNGTSLSSASTQKNSTSSSSTGDSVQLIVRPMLTNYRGAMLVATTLGILAVDFPIFPRRFAKVETWGTSLMDLGVGSFVFSAGIVSARAVLRISSHSSIISRFITALRHSLPLLVLGIARLISVKNLDYAEHVTEYGVHWNFFFTLALLPPFVELFDTLLRLTPTSSTSIQTKQYAYIALAISLAAIYETILNTTDLLSFILISPRTPSSSLLAKNREGVFSFIGYLAIFLAGRGLGVRLCRFDTPVVTPITTLKKTRIPLSRRTESASLRGTLARLSILFWALYLLVTGLWTLNLPVSRRLANLPYVLWITAFNTSQLLLFEILESLGPDFEYSDGRSARRASSPVMRAYNANGLAVFLIANLMTGVVNLTVNTLDSGSLTAMAVLVGYAAVVTGVAVGMDLMGWKVKL